MSTHSFIYLKFDKDKLEKRKYLQQMMLGKLVVHIQKNEIRPISITLHKNYLQMDQNLNMKPETATRKHRQSPTR